MNGAGFYFSGDPYRAVPQGVQAALAAPDACIKILAERGFGESTLCVKSCGTGRNSTKRGGDQYLDCRAASCRDR